MGCLPGIMAQAEDQTEAPTPARLIHEVQLGYFVGGSGTVYFFTYNSALSASLSTGWYLKENVALLGSLGIEQNIEGTLYPLTANLKKYYGTHKNQFVTLQAGYAFGSGENENSSFAYGGGPAGGIAYGINVLRIKQTKVYAQIGYKLRQTKLSFQPFEGSDIVSDRLDNHFLAFQLGVQF